MRNRRLIKSSIEDLSDVQFLYSHASKQSYYLFLTDKMVFYWDFHPWAFKNVKITIIFHACLR